jgi:hypothetical protein
MILENRQRALSTSLRGYDMLFSTLNLAERWIK